MKSATTESLIVGASLAALSLIWIAAGLPAAYIVMHGLDPAIWPPETIGLKKWASLFYTFDLLGIFDPYVEMYKGRSAAFPVGGEWVFWLLTASYVISAPLILVRPPSSDERRDPTGQLGNARWANRSETARMNSGIELGRDLQTGNPIRVRVESNLLSIAPPRTGKTSGLIINNLAVPDKTAWNGPAVVIDPKGDVFHAVARRRKQLGRRVVCFDLRREIKGSDRWNPIAEIRAGDVERLQNIARSLIVDGGMENKYFTERAIDVFAGTIATALVEARQDRRIATPTDVARLLSDPRRLLDIARSSKSQILRSLAADLQLDERARDQLLSTAKTGVSWLADERFQQLTADATFSMHEVARGDADLFIIVPEGSAELLAPLVRWMLADLLTAIDTARSANDERLLLVIDEASNLGRFDALERALGLLPGRGVSIWTFWQSLSQIEKHYGTEGAKVFLSTAEVVTVSDISGLSDEAYVFSRAIDNFTALVETASTQTSNGKKTESSGTSVGKQAVPLMPTEAIKSMPSDELIALLNSKRYGKNPVRMKKVRYFDDRRFGGLLDAVKPTASL